MHGGSLFLGVKCPWKYCHCSRASLEAVDSGKALVVFISLGVMCGFQQTPPQTTRSPAVYDWIEVPFLPNPGLVWHSLCLDICRLPSPHWNLECQPSKCLSLISWCKTVAVTPHLIILDEWFFLSKSMISKISLWVFFFNLYIIYRSTSETDTLWTWHSLGPSVWCVD